MRKSALASLLVVGLVTTNGVAQQDAKLDLDDWLKKHSGQSYDASSSSDTSTTASTTGARDDDWSSSVAGEFDDEDTGLFLRFNAGVNMLQDVEINDISFTYSFFPLLEAGLRDMSVSYDTGFDLNFALGFKIADSWSLEASVGVAQNEVSGVSASYFDTFFAPASTNVASISGGGGDLTQIPIMGNVRYGIDVSDTLEIGLSAGLGLQYTDFELRNMTVTELPSGPSYPLGVSVTGSNWSFRGQLGVDLQWELTRSVSLGLYARYSATSSTDFGSFDGTVANIEVDSFQNFAIGGSFEFTF